MSFYVWPLSGKGVLTLTEGRQLYPCFSKAEYHRRYKVIRDMMEERRLDALFFGDSTVGLGGQSWIWYLSGVLDPLFECMTFPIDGEPEVFVSNPLYLPNARKMGVEGIKVESFPRAANPGEFLGSRLKEGLRTGKVGLLTSLPLEGLRSPTLTILRLLPS